VRPDERCCWRARIPRGHGDVAYVAFRGDGSNPLPRILGFTRGLALGKRN